MTFAAIWEVNVFTDEVATTIDEVLQITAFLSDNYRMAIEILFCKVYFDGIHLLVKK